MMNNDMTGLLNLAYEIEGLLLLHINRGDEAAPEMKDLLVHKAESLLDGLKGVEAAQPESVQFPVPDMKTDNPAIAAVETVVSAPVEEVAEEAIDEAPTDEAVKEEVPVAGVSGDLTDEQAIAASASLEEEEDAAGTVDGKVIEKEEVEKAVADAPAEVLTLDEKLARERAADISKAFTLNDKFRFCRELFRNSNAEFKETLEVIGSMADMDEAEDYFYNDLCWDPDKEEVKEFMAIVGKHF